MYKKIASILLAIVLVLATPMVAFAGVGDNMYDETEPNNYTSSAPRMYADYTVSGNLNGADLDYFKFTLSSKAEVEFLAMASYRYLLAGILDASEEFVATATSYYDDGYYWDAISTTLPAGTYYLVLFPDSDSNYNYKITYTFYFNYTYTTTHTHSYTAKVTDPTCTTQGYTTYTCSCGDSYTSNYVAAVHTKASPVVENRVEATCVSTGSYDSVIYCSKCGERLSSETKTISINSNAHAYDNSDDMYCNLCGIERPAYTLGDVNEDSKINNRDYALLMQYINKWDVALNTDAADVNADGKINNRDYALLMQYINKWDVVLGGSNSDSSGTGDSSDSGSDDSSTDTETLKNWTSSELSTLKIKTAAMNDETVDLIVAANSASVFIEVLPSMAASDIAIAKECTNNIYNALLSIKPLVEANKDLSWVDIDGTVYYLKENFDKAWEYVNAMKNLNLSTSSSVATAKKYAEYALELQFYCMVIGDIAEGN